MEGQKLVDVVATVRDGERDGEERETNRSDDVKLLKRTEGEEKNIFSFFLQVTFT